MQEDIFKRFFDETGCLAKGHFVLSKKEFPPGSGNWAYLHSDTYLNIKDALLLYPHWLDYFSREIAKSISGKNIDMIVGPEKGAIALAPLVAIRLNEIQDTSVLPAVKHISACFSEKCPGDKMEIGRAFRNFFLNNPGIKCWIVDDTGEAGTGIRKTAAALREVNALVVGGSYIAVRRNIIPSEAGIPSLFWLHEVKARTWVEGECLLCQERGLSSINLKIGKGKEYLQEKLR